MNPSRSMPLAAFVAAPVLAAMVACGGETTSASSPTPTSPSDTGVSSGSDGAVVDASVARDGGTSGDALDAWVNPPESGFVGDAYGVNEGGAVIAFSPAPLADRVGKSDLAVKPDGEADMAIQVTLVGPATAITLITTNKEGVASGGQDWDTYTQTDPVPKELGVGFTYGAQTWVLGVYKGETLLNDPTTARVSLPAGETTVTLYASNSGYFKTGQAFRIILQDPDKSLRWSPIFVWP